MKTTSFENLNNLIQLLCDMIGELSYHMERKEKYNDPKNEYKAEYWYYNMTPLGNSETDFWSKYKRFTELVESIYGDGVEKPDYLGVVKRIKDIVDVVDII